MRWTDDRPAALDDVAAALGIVGTIGILRKQRRALEAARRESPFAVATEGMKRCPSCGMGNLVDGRDLLELREAPAGLSTPVTRPADDRQAAVLRRGGDPGGQDLADVHARPRAGRRRTAAIPSLSMTMQNGHAVATVVAPVSSDLAGPLRVDPRAAVLLHPHAAAAGAAAERVLAATCPSR